ncbi:91a903fc-2914-4225-89e5-165b17d536da [Sclerotinia trifoliorum]|uniref:91a903fc-2914-4225-89e5-165b17d536da n=1 Tax=Sclerotinia trifoliorum TaxID=28548 RepID=A0A8H2VUV1_9HELO|nr:91a903fc-2914-4225-89e5-165b17d536da [Sclerotinia trifoliorum]
MPSFSSLSIPNIGTANLTAILATSSLYAYLIALHQHQQKTLLKDQEERERERGKVQVQGPQQSVQEARIRNSGGDYLEEQSRSVIAAKRDTEDQRRYQYHTNVNSDIYTNRTTTTRNKMSKTFSPSEVAAHKDVENGMYIIIDEGVYDVASFLEEHPGGAKILKRVAGKDASKQFWKYHNEGVLKKYGEKLKIGTVGEKAKL